MASATWSSVGCVDVCHEESCTRCESSLYHHGWSRKEDGVDTVSLKLMQIESEPMIRTEAQTQPKLELPSVADIQCTQNAVHGVVIPSGGSIAAIPRWITDASSMYPCTFLLM